MPRKSSTAAPASAKASARRASGRAASPGQPSPAAAAASDTAPAAFMQGPLAMAAVWAQFADQLQRASERTWQGLRHDLALEAEDAQHADTPQRLAGVPAGAAAEQFARWTQLSSELTASLLDVQAAWFKELEAVAMQVLGPLFARDGRIMFGSAQDIVEPPGPNGPLQALWSAQKIWSESAKVWLQAMSHDLQDGAAAH